MDTLQQPSAADVMFRTRVCESLTKLAFCSKRKKKHLTEQKYFACASFAKYSLLFDVLTQARLFCLSDAFIRA